VFTTLREELTEDTSLRDTLLRVEDSELLPGFLLEEYAEEEYLFELLLLL
jgi:hypothetical protein